MATFTQVIQPFYWNGTTSDLTTAVQPWFSAANVKTLFSPKPDGTGWASAIPGALNSIAQLVQGRYYIVVSQPAVSYTVADAYLENLNSIFSVFTPIAANQFGTHPAFATVDAFMAWAVPLASGTSTAPASFTIPPINGIVDDAANTFTFTKLDSKAATDYEQRLGTAGGIADLPAPAIAGNRISVNVGNVDIAIGGYFVRAKAIAAAAASDWLSNLVAFTMSVANPNPELVPNGDFMAGIGDWAAPAEWSVNGGIVTVVNGQSGGYKQITGLVIGSQYRVRVNLTAYTSGNLNVYGAPAIGVSMNARAVGITEQVFTATATTTYLKVDTGVFNALNAYLAFNLVSIKLV